jgi:hypothetical protein
MQQSLNRFLATNVHVKYNKLIQIFEIEWEL